MLRGGYCGLLEEINHGTYFKIYPPVIDNNNQPNIDIICIIDKENLNFRVRTSKTILKNEQLVLNSSIIL